MSNVFAAGDHPKTDVEEQVDGGHADRPDRHLAQGGLAQHRIQVTAIVAAQMTHGLVLQGPAVVPAGNGDDDGASRLYVLGDLPDEADIVLEATLGETLTREALGFAAGESDENVGSS